MFIYFYEFEKHINMERQTRRLSVCWFVPHMPTTARAEPDQGQELRIPLGLPHVKKVPKDYLHHLLPPKKLEKKQNDQDSSEHSRMDAGIQVLALTSCITIP